MREVAAIRGFSGAGRRGTSELVVIVRAKELCGYVLTVTDKSPKKFRFTLVSRLQNYALDAVESLYKANLVRVRGREDAARMEERRELQRQAYVCVQTPAYLAQISREQGCILARQYEQISTRVVEVTRLLVAWAKADQRRYEGQG